MASTYSDLGLELMATGENAGTWGTKTNANLNLIEQISGGYVSVSIAGSAGSQALDIDDGALTGDAQNRVIEFTGSITGNRIITVPVNTENFYFIKNNTSGSYTVQLKAASGSGATVTWTATEKAWKLIYFDGVATNTGVYEIALASPPGGSNTQVQFNSSGSFGGSDNFTWDGSNVTIGDQGDLRLGDADNSHYVALQAPATVASNVTLTFPATDGDADQALTTNGSGTLAWTTISGGADWQAVKTTTYTAAAGQGVFANTTGGAWTLTLPSSPSAGDFVSVIDYAGTFDTNNLTIGRNGKKIQGATADLTVGTERAGFTLVFVDDTQGWLLQNN